MIQTMSKPRLLPRVLRRGAVMLTLVGALAACGNAPEDPLVAVGRSFVGAFTGGGGDAGQTADQVRAILTPANIAEIGQPFLVVNLVRADAASIMASVGSANGNTSWRDTGNNQLTLTDSGVLRSTRGFGPDLMSSDVGQTVNQLARGQAGPVQRTQVHVDGDFQSVPLSITCDVTVGARSSMVIGARTQSVRQVTEACRYGDQAFENLYWITGNGQVQKSVQWAGPELGHLEIELYIP